MRLALILALCACSAGERSPVGVVRALIEAARLQDRGEVYRLLGPRTHARLESAAKQAGDAVRGIKPAELLAVGWSSPDYRAARIEEVERSGDHATVEVAGDHGERDRVECVKQGSVWRVELP